LFRTPGAAHTFFSGETDKPRAGELINVLREAKQPVPDALLAFGTTVKKKESKLYGAHFRVRDVQHLVSNTCLTASDSQQKWRQLRGLQLCGLRRLWRGLALAACQLNTTKGAWRQWPLP